MKCAASKRLKKLIVKCTYEVLVYLTLTTVKIYGFTKKKGKKSQLVKMLLKIHILEKLIKQK